MSFALSTDDVEWGSLGLKAVFAQKKNLVSPSFLNMIREISQVWQARARGARSVKVRQVRVHDPRRVPHDERLLQILRRQLRRPHVRGHLVVLRPGHVGVSGDDAHQVLGQSPLAERHRATAVEGGQGSVKAYVDAVCAALPDVRTSTPVIAVERVPGGVKVTHKGPGATNRRRSCSKTSSSPATPTRPSPSSATPRPPRRRPRWVPSNTSPTRCTFTATSR